MNDIKRKTNNWFETIIICVAWLFVCLGFAAAGYGYCVLYYKTPEKLSLQNLGTYGSYLQGSVASLWSLAGLLFIYATFLSQQRQINQQEDELEEQKKQAALQIHSIQLQNFENSFFQLLQVLNQIVSEMRSSKTIQRSFYSSPDDKLAILQGRDCFENWFYKLNNRFIRDMNEIHGTLSAAMIIDRKPVAIYFTNYYKENQSTFGHYFRVLYHLIKFVDSSIILKTYTEKRRYTSLVRAQLSAYELVFLYYDGICPFAVQFKELLVKYAMFEHLDETLLLDKSHLKFYSEEARQ